MESEYIHGAQWESFNIMFAVIGGAIIGILPGAIGGLIVSAISKRTMAAMLGGAFGGLLVSPITHICGSCIFFGGC